MAQSGEGFGGVTGLGLGMAGAIGNRLLQQLAPQSALDNIVTADRSRQLDALGAECEVYSSATSESADSSKAAAEQAALPELTALQAFAKRYGPRTHAEDSRIKPAAPPDEMAVERLLGLFARAESFKKPL